MAGPANAPIYLEQLGGEERLLSLSDPSLAPEQGAGDGVTQRVARRWLPGATEPVTQILGPELRAMELTGIVRDNLAGDGAARHVDATLRALATEGFPVRLIWGEQWDKVGLIEDYQPEWTDEGAIRWRITYQPHASSDRDAGTIRRPEPRVQLLDVLREVGARIGALEGSLLAMERQGQRIQANVGGALTLLDDLGGAMAARSVSRISAAVSGLRAFRAELDALDDQEDGGAYAAGLAARTLDRVLVERTARLQLVQLDRFTADLLRAIEEQTRGRRRQVVVVRDGDTLEGLAARWLGSWEEWPRLAALNDLVPGQELVVGSELLIPTRTP